MDWRPNDENDRVALTILVGFLVARLAFALSLGLGIDESYTIAISRRLSLSYFDHPPLHLRRARPLRRALLRNGLDLLSTNKRAVRSAGNTHVAQPAVLAETSCSIRRGDCRAGDDNAGVIVFALMGAWLKQFGVSPGALRRLAVIASVLLAAIAGAAILEASTGWPWLALAAGSGLADPTLEAFEWRELRKAPVFDQAPSFVIATKWSEAGKIALALGPQIPVFVLSNDPRGWAFLDDSANFGGRSGVIVTPAADLTPALNPSSERSVAKAVGDLALIPADGLTRGLPMFYPGATGR